MKIRICFVALLLSSISFAESSITFSDLARKADGSVSYMTFDTAKTYCTERDGHLPTAREFAVLTSQRGGGRTKETSFPDVSVKDSRVAEEIERMGNVNFYAVYKYEYDDNKTVDFYYSPEGYIPPSGELGKEKFWTSSIYLSPGNLIYFQLYQSHLGIIWNADTPGELPWSGRHAVMCVLN